MIFCVEDDDNIRELVIYTLETTGLKARGFADGAGERVCGRSRIHGGSRI